MSALDDLYTDLTERYTEVYGPYDPDSPNADRDSFSDALDD